MPGVVENGQRPRTSITEKIPRHNDVSLYADPDRDTGLLRNERGHSPKTSSQRRGGGYEEVPDGPFNNEPAVRQKPSPPNKRRTDYEEVADSTAAEPEVRRKPSPFPSKRTELTPPLEAMYAQVDKTAKTKSRPNSINNMVDPPNEPYRQLNHFSPTGLQTPSQQDYGKLAHVKKTPSTQHPMEQDYARLESTTSTNAASGFQPAEDYGHLQHQPDEYGHLQHGLSAPGVSGYQPEEYGRLDRCPQAPATNGYQPEEYGRLDRSREPSPKAATSSTEEYGRLNSAFDPYGTLVGDELEEVVKKVGKTSSPRPRDGGYEMIELDDDDSADGAIYSEVDEGAKVSPKKAFTAPPPGYENTLLKVTPAEKASYSRSSSQDDKSPNTSPTPPVRSVKHKYVNVNDDGTVKLPPAPVVAQRKTRSNGVVSPSEERKPFNRGQTHLDSSPPPPAPRQRATVHGTRNSPPLAKPPTAPKPLKPRV